VAGEGIGEVMGGMIAPVAGEGIGGGL